MLTDDDTGITEFCLRRVLRVISQQKLECPNTPKGKALGQFVKLTNEHIQWITMKLKNSFRMALLSPPYGLVYRFLLFQFINITKMQFLTEKLPGGHDRMTQSHANKLHISITLLDNPS